MLVKNNPNEISMARSGNLFESFTQTHTFRPISAAKLAWASWFRLSELSQVLFLLRNKFIFCP